jgi:hypothetical protein
MPRSTTSIAASWLQKLWEVLAREGNRPAAGFPRHAEHGQRAIERPDRASGIECRGYDQAIEQWKDEMFIEPRPA